MMDVNGALVMLAQVGEAAAHTMGAAGGAGAGMGWDGWFTLAMVVLMLILMAATKISPDLIALGTLAVMVTVLCGLAQLTGVASLATHYTVKDAFSGFANEGMLAVAVLFIVAAALKETGGMSMLVQKLLGTPRSVVDAQIRLMFPVAAMSAFMNNTPLVAMMMPVVDDWCKKARLSASKLMIPLSYATMLGGACTLIGTSTNLIVHGLMKGSGDARLTEGLGMFEIAWVGVPSAVAGILFIMATTKWLLPERQAAGSVLKENPREYTVEMLVDEGGVVAGKTIQEAGLRQLPGMYLIEIEREGSIMPAVGPEERLKAGDRLVFTGIVESVVDLQKIRGLKPATNQVFKLDSPRARRTLIEAVVSKACANVGRSIKEGEFRKTYNAVVIAVGRQGERVRGKIGDIVLEAGDTLLLEAHPSFVQQQRNSTDFYLVSQVEDSAPPRHEHAWIALAILIGMVGLVTAERMTMLNAGIVAACLMVATRCISWTTARRSLEMNVILIIALTFGIGQAMEKTGAAAFIAHELLSLGGGNKFVALAMVYGVATLSSEMISHAGAASLIFPIAVATAHDLGVDPRPFAIALTLATACSFATPIGYQTNLMVMGAGGYRFSDYIKIGLPLDVLMWVMRVAMIPIFFPLR